MKRVDAAATFFNRQLNKDRTIIVFTGGPTAGKKTEAGVMADYAMKKYNVPQESIILEEKARSTQENAVLVAIYSEPLGTRADTTTKYAVPENG
jgi:predicted ATPase